MRTQQFRCPRCKKIWREPWRRGYPTKDITLVRFCSDTCERRDNRDNRTVGGDENVPACLQMENLRELMT